eukprot:gene34173-biopygen18219
MSGQLSAGLRGAYGQPTEKDAGTQTFIAGVQLLVCKGRSRDMGGQRGDGRGQRLSSPEVNRTRDQYRRAAIWCTKTRVAAVERLLEHPSRLTTKDVVLEERGDMLIEFQRLEEAIMEDMPWDRLRRVAAKERRRVMAWATTARDMQQEVRPGTQPSPNGSGSPGLSGPSPRGVLHSEGEVQRMVEAAVAAALAGRDPGSKGGSGKGRDPPTSLRDVTRASVGKRLGWTWSECERVITEIRVAAARQAADLAREQCRLEELHADRKVRAKHLYAYIELALQELAKMQRALAGVAGIVQPSFDEEWAAAAAASKKWRAVQQPSGSDGEDSEGEEKKRAAAKARFGSLRTATDKELRRALDGSQAVKDITRPPGEIAAPARPILPAGGALKGMDIRVSRPGRLRGGQRGVETGREAGIGAGVEGQALLVLQGVGRDLHGPDVQGPGGSRDLLLQFRKWMRLMSLDYSWDHLRKFYDHLCAQMEKEASTTFELVSYTAHWEMYKRNKGIKDQPAGAAPKEGAQQARGGAGGGRQRDAVKTDGEIVAEPGARHAENVTMAGDDWEPEPAGETWEMQVEGAEPWWERLRKMLVVPVWDAAGAPLPAAPVAAPAVPSAGTGCGAHYPAATESRSARWPALRAAIVRGAMARGLSGTGTTEEERLRFQQKVRDVGAQVPLMSERAHLLAEALKDWPDVAFLIDLQKDEFTSVKDAYALLRPGMYMVKVDLEEAYRSLPVASQYWAAQCFQWRGVRYMDTRSPFGNRALPGIFMRYTRAIVAWMQAQGVPCVGYLDDFFMVARTAAEAQEMMDLLIEFVTMLGFKVNRAKCEGPARRMEFLGVLLCIDGARYTASIDEERVQQVTSRLREMRAEAAAGPVRRRKLESLLGLLAFCAQDLKVVERVIRLYNGRKVVLHKEDVHEDAFATDA